MSSVTAEPMAGKSHSEPTHGICPVCREAAPILRLWLANRDIMRAHGRCEGKGRAPVRIFNPLALLAEVDQLRARVAELEGQRNRINDLPPSKQALAAMEIMRRPIRRKHQDGGERREA